MKHIFVVNPAAGQGKNQAMDFIKPRIEAVCQKYSLDYEIYPTKGRGDGITFVKERAKVVPERMQEVGAQALLVYMHFNDESYIWDFPKQKLRLDELGLPAIVVEKQNIPIVEPDALKARLADFFKTVKGGK